MKFIRITNKLTHAIHSTLYNFHIKTKARFIAYERLHRGVRGATQRGATQRGEGCYRGVRGATQRGAT